MSTRAIQFLGKQGVPYGVVKYEHIEKGAEFASQAIGLPLEQTIKTLVVDVSPEGPVFLLMPGHVQADMKALAKALKAKRAALADTKTAERLTGYLVGGISPFGSKKRLPVYMEASLLDHREVAINGGQRGTLLIMSPRDILKAASARTITVSQ
ncbi:MAG: Cys-tRNA(Pro) deacylase [Deltaproteobacteria bacterium]|nr:Cys-tRNA(Pro) deacylase [Deltaproteobacteria bacterium]